MRLAARLAFAGFSTLLISGSAALFLADRTYLAADIQIDHIAYNHGGHLIVDISNHGKLADYFAVELFTARDLQEDGQEATPTDIERSANKLIPDGEASVRFAINANVARSMLVLCLYNSGLPIVNRSSLMSFDIKVFYMRGIVANDKVGDMAVITKAVIVHEAVGEQLTSLTDVACPDLRY